MQSAQECRAGEGRASVAVPEPRVVPVRRGGDLESSGWERRFEADDSRVAELTELYSSLGYEVMTVGLDPEAFGPECTGCALTACQRYVVLYTRRPIEAVETGGAV